MHDYNDYYNELCRYAKMATWQHEHCNLGTRPHSDLPWNDDLLKNITLYDVVARQYAGFGQMLLDLWHPMDVHPYRHKMWPERVVLVESASARTKWDTREWLYLWLVHRFTGSAINYGLEHAGYGNSPLGTLAHCENRDEMITTLETMGGEPIYTSKGYQIFSAPPKPDDWDGRAGDAWLCREAPRMLDEFEEWLDSIPECWPVDFRDAMDWLLSYSQESGWRRWKFHYAAFLGDIADYMPEIIDPESHYFYGSNAAECLKYMSPPKPSGVSPTEWLDRTLDAFCVETNTRPYDAEDIVCDGIRWLESMIDPRFHYRGINRDKVFSSHRIYTHPYGRQWMMLDLGLVETFNDIPRHPSDDYVLRQAGITAEQYREQAVLKITQNEKK